jgi:hypothetical protein
VIDFDLMRDRSVFWPGGHRPGAVVSLDETGVGDNRGQGARKFSEDSEKFGRGSPKISEHSEKF